MNSLLRSSRRAVAVVFAFSTMLFSQEILAQSTSSTTFTKTASPSPFVSNTATAKRKNQVETSVSVGSMAQLTATRTLNATFTLTSESFAPSAGVFATFRQSFKPWLGYSVNLGYTKTTYRNTFSPAGSTVGKTLTTFIDPRMYEISASYIAQKRLTNKLTVFGEAGGGTLVAAAKNQIGFLSNRTNEYTPEGIAGFGVDYRLSYGLGLRAQYRGLFTRYPYPDSDPGSRLKTVISEPTFSLTYTFGSHAHR